VTKEDELLSVLNNMVQCCEPFKYDDFNVKILQNGDALMDAEKLDDRIGIANIKEKFGMSTFSLIATITDVLIGKRLAFMVEDDGTIARFCWYQGDK
jgi:hypothetical protein